MIDIKVNFRSRVAISIDLLNSLESIQNVREGVGGIGAGLGEGVGRDSRPKRVGGLSYRLDSYVYCHLTAVPVDAQLRCMLFISGSYTIVVVGSLGSFNRIESYDACWLLLGWHRRIPRDSKNQNPSSSLEPLLLLNHTVG